MKTTIVRYFWAVTLALSANETTFLKGKFTLFFQHINAPKNTNTDLPFSGFKNEFLIDFKYICIKSFYVLHMKLGLKIITMQKNRLTRSQRG
jgi:hypothetical protein